MLFFNLLYIIRCLPVKAVNKLKTNINFHDLGNNIIIEFIIQYVTYLRQSPGSPVCKTLAKADKLNVTFVNSRADFRGELGLESISTDD